MGRATNIEIIHKAKHRDVVEEVEANVQRIVDELGISADFSAEVDLGCPYEHLVDELTLRIDPQGTVFPCQAIDHRQFALGNIHVTSATSLISNIHDFSKYVANRQSNIVQCQRCAYQALCKGGCIATALSHSGDPLSIDDACSVRKSMIMQRLSTTCNLQN
jgi:radical SAM protein with 4Fe4S-binding SPASM domain